MMVLGITQGKRYLLSSQIQLALHSDYIERLGGLTNTSLKEYDRGKMHFEEELAQIFYGKHKIRVDTRK
jgi:hypothetical protein